jgi:hypothetical protein
MYPSPLIKTVLAAGGGSFYADRGDGERLTIRGSCPTEISAAVTPTLRHSTSTRFKFVASATVTSRSKVDPADQIRTDCLGGAHCGRRLLQSRLTVDPSDKIPPRITAIDPTAPIRLDPIKPNVIRGTKATPPAIARMIFRHRSETSASSSI